MDESVCRLRGGVASWLGLAFAAGQRSASVSRSACYGGERGAAGGKAGQNTRRGRLGKEMPAEEFAEFPALLHWAVFSQELSTER